MNKDFSSEKYLDEGRTNHVFFSPYVRRFGFWKRLQEILEKDGTRYEFLPETKDYWVRDFMPVQVSEGYYAGYRYFPDYLKGKEQYISNGTAIAERMGLPVTYSDIIVDGGNVIRALNKVIMTDKVVSENGHIGRLKLIDSIEELFQAELFLIPWDRNEEYGHADGMVRHIEGNKLLLTNYCDFDKSFRDKIMRVLSSHFDITELHYDVDYPSSRNWAYINFLHVGDTIVIPQLGIKEDSIAQKQIEETFCRPVDAVNITNLLHKGGGLNCISWNIFS